jgi:hypothetical protein
MIRCDLVPCPTFNQGFQLAWNVQAVEKPMHFAFTILLVIVGVSKADTLPYGSWMLAGPVVLFLYYAVAWWNIGPEPKPGPLVTRYEPPAGLSAAAVRYVARGVTNGRSLAAVISQLAARGCIRVEPVAGKYRLSRLMCGKDAVDSLAPEEHRVLATFFKDAPVIELSPSMDQRNSAQNGLYISQIHEKLTRQYHGKYFTSHFGIVALGIFATFLMALPSAAFAPKGHLFDAAFFTMWILFAGLILGMILEISFIPALQNALRSGVGLLRFVPGIAVFAVFVTAIIFMMLKLASQSAPALPTMLAAFLAVNLVWPPLLKRRSPLGRQVADEIAGFHQFLEKVERDPLAYLDPHGPSPRDLNRFLPYAIALEVKEAWGDHLAETFLPLTVMVDD